MVCCPHRQRTCHCLSSLLSPLHRCSNLLTFSKCVVKFKSQRRGTWEYSMCVMYFLLVLAIIIFKCEHIIFPLLVLFSSFLYFLGQKTTLVPNAPSVCLWEVCCFQWKPWKYMVSRHDYVMSINARCVWEQSESIWDKEMLRVWPRKSASIY